VQSDAASASRAPREGAHPRWAPWRTGQVPRRAGHAGCPHCERPLPWVLKQPRLYAEGCRSSVRAGGECTECTHPTRVHIVGKGYQPSRVARMFN